MTNIAKQSRANGLAVLLALGLGPIGCSLTVADAQAKLDAAMLKAVVDDDQVQGAVMWVDAPTRGIDRGFSAGEARAGVPMTLETPFLSASVGKLVVAVTVLSLVQEGLLSLDDPMTRFVPAAVLAGLPVDGGDPTRVTVRMLLAHTSGLPDYFSDPSKDGAPRLFDLIAQDKNRTYTRADLLAYARDHYAPVHAPGAGFHYSDTNYDLLGLVMEGATGQPFHSVVRARVLAPLGMTTTWYHASEPAPVGIPAAADVYVGNVNLAGAASLSADQAGGGLITTVADLRTFVRALTRGKPVAIDAFVSSCAKDAAAAPSQQSASARFHTCDAFTADAMHKGIDVGLAVWRIRPGDIFFALSGLPTLVGHSGATGVWAYFAPEMDAVLVGAVSQSAWQEKHIEFLLSEVLPTLTRIEK